MITNKLLPQSAMVADGNFLFSFLQASLNAGLDLKSTVVLPDDEELNDWIAVHGK